MKSYILNYSRLSRQKKIIKCGALSVESKCLQHHCLTQTLYLQSAILYKDTQTQLADMRQQETLVRNEKI